MDTKTPRWELIWAVQRSQRYHARREAFFDGWRRVTSVCGLVFGSAVMLTLIDNVPQVWAAIAALPVVLMSAIDLVVGTAQMARIHHDLRRRFCELEALIQHVPSATPKDIARWTEQRLAIEAVEPPAHVALNVLVENELLRIYRHLKDEQPHPLPWHKRATAHWFRWENA